MDIYNNNHRSRNIVYRLNRTLSKAMGDLSMKDQEIEKLKMQLQKIQEQKMKSNNVYLAEIQKNYKLTQ